MITDYQQMLSDVQLRQQMPGFSPEFVAPVECSAPKQQIDMPKDETSINSKKERRIQALGMIISFRKAQ